jgi:hypothetical protein
VFNESPSTVWACSFDNERCVITPKDACVKASGSVLLEVDAVEFMSCLETHLCLICEDESLIIGIEVES